MSRSARVLLYTLLWTVGAIKVLLLGLGVVVTAWSWR
jgi:hypothetical protein